ncbi:hypothetical protein OHA25_52635 [Nonomuraea sp. NBC_00507]|uniref:hypothetical protein n=1 Tax=Nonomuraea sp. NBC_00507 TaxID=2976002 RepID=UPI002E17B5CB
MRIVTGIVAAVMGVTLLTGPTTQAASAASDRSGLGSSSGIGWGKGISSTHGGNASKFGG